MEDKNADEIPQVEPDMEPASEAIHRSSTVSTLHHNQFNDSFLSRYGVLLRREITPSVYLANFVPGVGLSFIDRRILGK